MFFYKYFERPNLFVLLPDTINENRNCEIAMKLEEIEELSGKTILIMDVSFRVAFEIKLIDKLIGFA